MEAFSSEELRELLSIADVVVSWTTQDTLKRSSAGMQHLVDARQKYYKRLIEVTDLHGEPVTISMTGGCICGWTGSDHKVRDDCMYHYAARLQPWNHRLAWNCPTYYDGCNCEKEGSGT
jgi:hypothetical protein